MRSSVRTFIVLGLVALSVPLLAQRGRPPVRPPVRTYDRPVERTYDRSYERGSADRSERDPFKWSDRSINLLPKELRDFVEKERKRAEEQKNREIEQILLKRLTVEQNLKLENARKEREHKAAEQAERSRREAQFLLRALGMYQGQTDGVIGPLTSRALVAFQTEYGLEVDGKLGPETTAALERARYALRLNKNSQRPVLMLQGRVADALYALYDTKGRPIYKGGALGILLEALKSQPQPFQLALRGFSRGRASVFATRLFNRSERSDMRLKREADTSSDLRITFETGAATATPLSPLNVATFGRTRTPDETILDYERRDPQQTLRQRIIALDTTGDFSVLRTPRGNVFVLDAGLRAWTDADLQREVPAGSAVKLVLSHLDADHIGNAVVLLRRMDIRVDEVIFGNVSTGSRRVQELIETLTGLGYIRDRTTPTSIGVYRKPGISSTLAAQAVDSSLTRYRMSVEPGLDVEVFQVRDPKTPNEASLATLVTHNGTHTLYTGDATSKLFQGLVEAAPEVPQITFFKWPHHAWIPKTAEEQDAMLAAIDVLGASRIVFSVRPSADLEGQSVEGVEEFLIRHFPDRHFDFFVTREDGTIMLLTLREIKALLALAS